MELRRLYERCKNYILSLSTDQKKAIRHVIIIFIVALCLLILLYRVPQWQVAQFKLTNQTDIAKLENNYRATFTQILGGSAVLIGIYFAWKNLQVAQTALKSDQEKFQKNLELALATLESNRKNAQDNLQVAQEGQITERFTRAVDQLGAIDKKGNPATEIRLGGIYSLERISNESEKDYWPIMEILTAYVRKNSFIEEKTIKAEDIKQRDKSLLDADVKKLSLDIQAILTVLGKRKHSFNDGEANSLNLRGTCLQEADLAFAHLEGANLEGAHLEGAYFEGAHFEGAHFEGARLKEAHLEGANLEGANLKDSHFERANLRANLEEANLKDAHLEGANLKGARLEGANLEGTNLEGANFEWANLEGANLEGANLEGANLEGARLKEANLGGANLEGANLEGANLEGANLGGALILIPDMLSKVKTLYNAKLDEDLRKDLENKYPDEYKALIKIPDLYEILF